MVMQAAINSLPNPTEEQQLLQCLAQGEINAFWQLFEQHRDYLFRCCVKWMNGNSIEAEDLLSQAMLKALEKAQKYAGKIENFKSWVTTLTRNFWIDLKRRPCANQVENIEVYGEREDIGWVLVDDTPGSALERDDKNRVIRAAIDELPTKIRETFILHFYEELSYQEIAGRQGISYQNVCKRISQARGILVKELRGYFIGDADTKSDTTKVEAKPIKSKKVRKKIAKVEVIAPETEPSISGVNTEYANPKPEEQTQFLAPTDSQGETTDQEAIELNRESAQTSDFIQDQDTPTNTLLSFPPSRESTFPCINTFTNIGIDSS
ncbi:MAG TPA: sigma-70 family RNA polymerase sigma factor [Candidatus Obscuribacterales bacterium]